MSDIFDEAKSELENIKKAKVIKNATYIFIVISIIAIFSTAIYGWMENRREERILAQSDQFLAIFDNSDQKLSEKQIERLMQLATQDDSGFAAMSLLIIAKQNYDDKNHQAFIENMQKIIDNKSFDISIRDYATLNLSNYFLSNNMLKQASEKINETDIDSSPYRSILELNLALIMIKENKKDDSIKTLNAIISDPSSPDVIIKDSKAMLYIIEKMEKNA